MVLVKRSSPLQSVVTGRNSGVAGLMGTMGAAEPLDGAVGAPARLEQEVDALLLVLGIKRGMVGAARATGVGEDQDPLAAFHERRGLDLAGAGRARLELLTAIGAANEPLGAARDLGDLSVRNARSCASSADMIGGSAQRCSISWSRAALCLRIVDRIAVLVDHRHRARGAGVVGEDLHLPRRESALEIVDHVLARRKIDLEVGALLGRRAAPRRRSRIASAVVTSCSTTDWPAVEMSLDRGDDGRQLHREQHLTEEALLGRLRTASVPPPWRRCSASRSRDRRRRRSARAPAPCSVDDAPGIGIGVVDLDLRRGQRRARGSRTRPRRS